jgi:glycosyltransferase involved in cell wall biosynthesis
MDTAVKNDETLLSVITICLNQPDIEETCESVIAQTFQDFEWIVIDGGSSDGTLKKLEKYKNRMDVFVSEKDEGRYHAMNKGIRLAKGQYLNFLNGGDSYFDVNTLEKVINTLKYRIKIKLAADIYWGAANFVYENKEIIFHHSAELTKTYFFFNNINHQSTLIKRSLFENYGYYNEQMKILGDYESWFLFLKNKCIFRRINQVIANFKVGGISSKQKEKQFIIERANTIRKYFTNQEISDLYYSNLKCWERIFSIKRELDYKIIRILGLKIKYNYTNS